MKVTIHEIFALRHTLAVHRVEHERLVTQMRILREQCLELRRLIAESRGLSSAQRSRPDSGAIGGVEVGRHAIAAAPA